MARADFRFHAELNDFLPPSQRQVSFTHCFKGRASIKDMIEALGVPHPEVDSIAVNGEAVDFSYIVQDGDRIEVYPISALTEITPTIRVRPPALSIPRFVLDVHLLTSCTMFNNPFDPSPNPSPKRRGEQDFLLPLPW